MWPGGADPASTTSEVLVQSPELVARRLRLSATSGTWPVFPTTLTAAGAPATATGGPARSLGDS